jgi:1-acyl-sn-glycerol-3-phosphate acyltransferase
MYKLLKFLFSIWAVVAFMLISIPILLSDLIVRLLPYKKQIKGVYITNRIFIFIWSAFTGYRYKIRGLENIRKNQTYVTVVNHVNMADMVAAAYGIRVSAKPLIKKELLRIPILGQVFALACLPIDRSSKQSRHESKIRMLKDLKNGISVLILPEGTRNRSKQPLLPFYDGAFELAIEAQVPILPVVFTNIRAINKVDTLLIQPGILEVTHLTPISTIGLTIDHVQELKNKTYQVMQDFILKHDEYFERYSIQVSS